MATLLSNARSAPLRSVLGVTSMQSWPILLLVKLKKSCAGEESISPLSIILGVKKTFVLSPWAPF